jgi:predicted permease
MFWRHRRLRDFSAEIEAHLLLEADRLKEEGLSEADAIAAARRSFGNAAQAQERFCESIPGFAWSQLWQDLRYGLRILAKNPATTAMAILTLALALGVNTAIFSVLDAALLKSLPVSNPNELVMLTDPNASMTLGGTLIGARSLLTYSEFLQLRDRTTTLFSLCAAQLTLERWPIRVAGSEPEQARGRLVSENYFSTFRVQPAIGRLFTQRDATAVGKDPYAVISYDYWQRRFGGRPAVIGTTIRLRKASVVIVGVAPRDFHGETVGQEPDLWVPLLMQPLVMPGSDALRDTLPHSQDKFMWLHVFGRRKAGVSTARVQAEVNVLFRAILDADYPATMPAQDRRRAFNQHIVVQPVRTGAFHGRKEFSQEWTLLLALAALILLAACANVANLLLARAAARSREVAIRLSIGAARARLIRQFLTESLLLAVLGGLASIFVAEVSLRALLRILSDANDGFTVAASLDLRVLGFSACATLLTAVLFGVVPAVRAVLSDVNPSLKHTGRGATGSRKHAMIGKTLVVTQVALSLLLVAGAGLFLRTLWNLQSVALGYPRGNLLLMQVDSSDAGYQGARTTNLFHDLATKIRQIPGVRAVSYSGRGLFSGFEGAFPVEVEGFTSEREEDIGSTGDSVGPGYFSTIGIPILLGREIGVHDLARPPQVCVINEAFASRFFAGHNPLGKHVTSVLSDDDGIGVWRRLQVIGVAKNVRVQSLRGTIDPKFYVPGGESWLEIRTADDPGRVLNTVRKAIFAVDGKLTIQSAKTLKQMLSMQDAQSRLIAQLATGFGLLALVLAAAGIYGLLSYELGRRAHEIGIRMALGAHRRQVIAMILKQTSFMIFAGVATGIAATAACARMLATRLYGFEAAGPRWSLARYEHVDSAIQLYGLSAMDPMTIGVAVGVLCGFALVAAYLPAARAAQTDPVHALRNE